MIRAFTALIVFAATISSHAAAQTSGGALRLTLECRQGSDPSFQFEIDNISDAPAAVVIGTILGNDKTYILGHLELTVKIRGDADKALMYFDPKAPVGGPVGGRVDPWLVPLPANTSYSMTLAAHNSGQCHTWPGSRSRLLPIFNCD